MTAEEERRGRQHTVPVVKDSLDSLRDQEKITFQASLLDAVGQSVMAADGSGYVRYWNDATQEMLGWSAEEALGCPLEELNVFDAGVDVRAIMRFVARGESWVGEHWVNHRDGRRVPVYSTITPLFDSDGELIAVIDVTTDLTSVKRTEAEMRRLSALVESSNDAINGADLDGVITSWNAGAAHMYGYTAAEVVGQSVAILTPPGQDGVDGALRSWLRNGSLVVGREVAGLRKDGSVLDVSLTLSPVYDADGSLIGTSAIARDVTELRRLRAAVELERDRLSAAQEMAHVGSVEVDMVTGSRWWSEEYFRIHGLPLNVSPTEELWLSVLHPEDRERVRTLWQALEDGGPPMEVVHRVVRPDREVRWVQTRATAEHDDDGVLLKLVETTVDITDRKLAESALELLAFEDPLTGLANRVRLLDSIEQAQAVATAQGTQVGVLFMDVDRFKIVNDGMGHAAGDSLLAQLANRLRGAVRPQDLLARFAGDEFVIVCTGICEEETLLLAERIAATIKAPFNLQGREVFITVSVGIALSGEDYSAESLLHNADAAMYRAKQDGRGEPVVFDEEMHRSAKLRLDIGSELPRVIERGELEVYYQPIMDVASGRPVGAEALLRWRHPEHGLINPEVFIPVAEETALIVPIGRWVLNEALTQAQRWRESFDVAGGFGIAVNLSARQLHDVEIYDTVAEAIEAAGIDPSAVELEMTESVLMQNVGQSLETLTKLRRLGVGLSIDDFGTGYSSLSYLRRFPVTTLKIDRSFVDELDGVDIHARPIVEAITMLAHALSLNVVAEGVETEKQLEVLHELRANHAQGYFWSKPVPAAELELWLKSFD
ncbi:EAL and GGDEF domain-containing protein [Arthrobacter roseus]|uniref:sensor domain-containing protein n=1 Tax=Arthrobacter roseus TaxID=136274 RepID=UPI00196401D9|nr:EAL domain-containing protein [Arthrobacter roseus]MBM7849299.1 diguanylate cyclase (GGDEF)-like protein/PAS domain S-box-containing protein [Arthrobacter roseus]